MFTIAEYAEGYWIVMDEAGEHRHTAATREGGIAWASVFTSQAQDAEADLARRRQDALAAEAHNFVREGYRRGMAQAYRHCAMRLSFLMGGTLPRGSAAFRSELDSLLLRMGEWEAESKEKADQISAQIEEHVQAKLDA